VRNVEDSETRAVNRGSNPCRGATCLGANGLSPLVHEETLKIANTLGFREVVLSPFATGLAEIGLWTPMRANVSDGGFGVARYLTDWDLEPVNGPTLTPDLLIIWRPW